MNRFTRLALALALVVALGALVGACGSSSKKSSAPSKPGVTATATDTSYKLTVKSKSGNSFVLAKDVSGPMKRTCTTGGQGGCPAGGSW
jgi:ABC-type oligopeptide transport system substrate-binding subunit